MSLGVLLGLALCSEQAVAERGPFDVPEPCATEAEFLELVRERLAPGVSGVPQFELRVEAQSGGYFGELKLGLVTRRELLADSCVEILDAAAVILALRAERLQQETAAAGAPPSRAPSLGWLPDTNETPNADANVAATETETARSIDGAPSARSGNRARSRQQLGWRAGVGATSLGKVAPGTAIGPGLVMAVDGEGAVAWSLRLAADHTETGIVAAADSPGTWAKLTVGRLTGCASQVRIDILRLQPCLQLGVGRLEAGGVAGGSIVEVSSVRRPWLSLGPTVRAELLIAHRWVLGAEAGAPLPFIDQELTFRVPDSSVHRSGWFSSYIGLSAEFVLRGSKSEAAAMAR